MSGWGGRSRTALGLTGAALVLSACGGGQDTADGGPQRAEVTLTVLAAASLTDVLADAEAGFAADHAEISLRFSFAGSQELAAQIREGLPADALLTADRATMDQVADFTGDPVVFAENELTIVTALGNPRGVSGLADLGDDDLTLVLAAPEVPAGRYAARVLDNAEVSYSPASQETNVRSVLTKVAMGEADAGLVYATDAANAGQSVTSVPLDPADNVLVEYPAAVPLSAPNPEEAAEFLAWLESPAAVRLLTEAGFRVP